METILGGTGPPAGDQTLIPRDVWVRVVGTGTRDDMQRPDLPRSVNRHDVQIPTDANGRPLVGVCRATLDDGAVAVDEVAPPPRDRALVLASSDAVNTRDATGVFADGAAATAAFAEIAAAVADDPDRQAILEEALVLATTCGLRVEHGEAIARVHGILEQAAPGGA